MDPVIEEIKNKIDIVEFINTYVPLKKAGRNFKACCPFHQEKTPSFIVSPERQIWHCFGACNEGGDVIQFLRKIENITFYEALQELAKQTGIKLNKISFQDKEWGKKEKIIKLNQLATDFYHYILTKTLIGEKARAYLTQRKINPKIIAKFELGYAPDSWDSLIKFLLSKGYSLTDLDEAGLIIRSDASRYYDRFRGRIMFPIKDVRNKVIAFAGRLLYPDEKVGKYVNTPETALYHKRETLYGIHLTKEAIRRENKALIVEGEFDLISPYQYGIEYAVAVKGTALTREQLLLLKHYTSRLIFALDADTAGLEALKRGIYEAERLEFEMYAIRFGGGKDPDEAVHKDPFGFKKILEKPLPIYDYLIESLQHIYPLNEPFSKKRFADEILPFISRIRNPIIYTHYLKKIASLLGVEEKTIEQTIAQKKKLVPPATHFILTTQVSKQPPREERLQKYLLSYLLQHERPYELADRLNVVLQPTDFTVRVFQQIYAAFIAYRQSHPQKFQINDFLASVPKEIRYAADEAFLYRSLVVNEDATVFDRLMYELRRLSLKTQIQAAAVANDLSDEKKSKRLSDLQKELKEVEKYLTTV